MYHYDRSMNNVSLMSILRRMTSVTQDLEREIQANGDSSDYNSWTDIQPSEEGFTIELSLPNVQKSDIDIQISDDRVLTIHAAYKVSRSIYIPEEADVTAISAKYENELLIITLPRIKRVPRTIQKISIQ
jgi:HSP20 family molecular chaperone IbpA